MTSERQAIANRRNARQSTGPRTSDGKARAAGNARRHGLTAGTRDPSPLAQQIAQELSKSPQFEGSALELAGLQELLLRIRLAKAEAVAAAFQRVTARDTPGLDADELDALALIDAAPELLKLDEYERKAMSRRRRMLRDFED